MTPTRLDSTQLKCRDPVSNSVTVNVCRRPLAVAVLAPKKSVGAVLTLLHAERCWTDGFYTYTAIVDKISNQPVCYAR